MARSAAKKTKAKTKGAKAHRSSKSGDDRRTHPIWSPSHLAVAAGGVALSIGGARLATRYAGDDGGGEHALSPLDLLERVRKSRSFDLADDGGNRTLKATADIPAGTVLMEIPRELMVWDLDAARDDFIQRELFDAPFMREGSSDTMSKRAALLSAYLALLQNDAVSPRQRERTSAARAMPSYDEFASFHPVLADVDQLKRYLGEHSISFLHLAHVRESLHEEYAMLASASTTFASKVSRESYLACRLAVQSRAFQISNVASEVSKAEREHFKQTLGIDFGAAVVSIEPVNDWMNTHVNNNVKVGGYDAVTRSGQATAMKDIPNGQELINSYGKFYDHILFSQYGFVPTDGTGTSIASLFVYHDIDLMGELLGEANDALPPLETLAPYLRRDYGYAECISKETDSAAFELKRVKLSCLQHIAVESSRWALPLPPRVSTDATPFSTTTIPDGYKVPSFGPEVYEYFEANALSLSLPCRLITLTERDVENSLALLEQDLETLQSSNTGQASELRLEELEVSMNWMMRTVHCMATLASAQMQKYSLSVEEQEKYVLSLVKAGNTNSLEWNAAHVKLEEMQSQEALQNWAIEFWNGLAAMESVPPEELLVRDEPCPEEYTVELYAA